MNKYVEFEVFGPYALFSDPIMRVGGEKMSYMIPTYEVVKNICNSIYWKPTFIWKVDSLRVLNKIQTESKGIKTLKYNQAGNDLSYYTYLKNVRYQVRAHICWNFNREEFEADRNYGKHMSIISRSLEGGGRRDIFLGTRECQGYVKPCKFGSGKGVYDELSELSFGLAYHGMSYPDEAIKNEDKNKLSVRFWRPVMRNGVIDFLPPEQCKLVKYLRNMNAKIFENKK